MGWGGFGQGPKRVGMWYVALLVLGAAGALALARYFALGTAATTAALLPTLAPAYLAWKAFQQDRADPGALARALDTAADQLAQAVGKQWDAESAIRRINDPYPLPVAWRPADPDLVESWSRLTELARGWPGGPPSDPAGWPEAAADLAGADADIGEVFTRRVPTRRLVVLGEPGSGKTMLLVRLLQELVQQRAPGGPVPVLFSLASWNPAHQSLDDWLTEELRRAYPGLRAPAPANMAANGHGNGRRGRAHGSDLARALLDARRVLLILDGLDELPPVLHETALDRLNLGLSAGRPVILASRAAPYRDALTRPDSFVRLNGAAGIHLLPLTAEAAAAYLRRDAGGEHTPAAARWDAVISRLGTDAPVGQSLSTPLGLFLARTIHNPRPGTLRRGGSAVAPHPDTLCDTSAYPTRVDLDAHLFNAFIPAAYTPHHPDPPRWPAGQAYRTLALLARHLEHNRDGSPDLAWWELHHALAPRTTRITVGLVFGLLSGVAVGFAIGPAVGLASGLAVGLATKSLYPGPPSPRARWAPAALTRRLVLGLPVGLAAGCAVGLAGGRTAGLAFGFAGGLVLGLEYRGIVPRAPRTGLRWSSDTLRRRIAFGLLVGLVAGLVGGPLPGVAFGLAGGLAGALKGERPDVTTVIGPSALLTQDRRTFLTIGFVSGAVVGIVVGVMVGLKVGLAGGLAFGLAFGLAAGLAESAAWVFFRATTVHLAARHGVPWDLMAFLRDAHEQRGVLRQVGGLYQFRHLDLQRHLARQPWPPPPAER
ncbi:NACHT domain-containing NTPase [Streptomyces sp. NK08204]|uniref:NACHT domain-containing protein n=1 Tax=Streptomyces sp. NK08204 TaxID=2873260 RepID=UPI001CECEA9C|nr:NACHT domain-containing protein [Streptomyces sp. NK08204]